MTDHPTETTDRHGTYAEYQAHRGRGEPACQSCKDAAAAYARAYRAKRGSEPEQAYNRARYRALSRLAARHPAEFVALLAEERACTTRQPINQDGHQ